MLTDRQILGLRGEALAARWLASRGWTILDQRFRSGHRDIDIIAAKSSEIAEEQVIAFVEVRTRSSVQFGTPVESVGFLKRRELRRAAADWLSRHQHRGATIRFDIVGILVRGSNIQVEHIEDAF